MADPIEVVINIHDYPENMKLNTAMWETWVVGKLKEAGVPVDGFLQFNGIKSGTLTKLDDPADFGKSKYVWTP